MLAEAVSIDFGALLIVLVIGLVALTVFVTLVVFGFVLAPRAGRGSRGALGWWIVILAVEGGLCLVSIAAVASGDFSGLPLVAPAVVAAQVALFVLARRDRP